MPNGYSVGWQGLSYDEANKGNTAIYIFAIVVVFVYLVLVGQHESFLLPLPVIMSLPVGLFGSFLFLKATGLANDVYCQIGLVMLVGLLGKNAIWPQHRPRIFVFPSDAQSSIAWAWSSCMIFFHGVDRVFPFVYASTLWLP